MMVSWEMSRIGFSVLQALRVGVGTDVLEQFGDTKSNWKQFCPYEHIPEKSSDVWKIRKRTLIAFRS